MTRAFKIVIIVTFQPVGSVAEWSKALVLGTSHVNGVGSNPTAAINFFFLFPFSASFLFLLSIFMKKLFYAKIYCLANWYCQQLLFYFYSSDLSVTLMLEIPQVSSMHT